MKCCVGSGGTKPKSTRLVLAGGRAGALLLVLRLLVVVEITAAIAGGGPRTFGRDLKERYDTGEQWTTLQTGVEFQPAAELSPLAMEHLRRLTTSSAETNNTADATGEYNSPYHKLFVDGR